MKRNPAWNGQGDWCGFPCVEMNRVRSCLGLRSALHCLLLRACAPWIYVCAAFKAHLCPDKQIFMITTREGAVRTLFFQTRHTEKCYQIAQLRSQGKKNTNLSNDNSLVRFEDAGCIFYCWYVHSTSHGPFEELGGFAQQLRQFRLTLSFSRGTRNTCGMWLVEMDSLRCMTPRFAAWQVQQVRLIMFLFSSSSF